MDAEWPSQDATYGAAEFFAELDRLGEAEVEEMLNSKVFAATQVPFVREWLLRRAEERARRQAETDQS